ncbi:hypothetical protein AAMO2058_001559100, partial [Amorphochlora amoebiformis]
KKSKIPPPPVNRKGEAEQFAKKGLFANLKSHVCWHVYGLIHRSERRYQDAIKCYQNALKYDKDNLLILKDLSMLQIQRKDHDGFQETRRKILLLKSDQRINWIAYAVGNHLLGDYSKCLHILDTFIKTLDSNKVSHTFLFHEPNRAKLNRIEPNRTEPNRTEPNRTEQPNRQTKHSANTEPM